MRASCLRDPLRHGTNGAACRQHEQAGHAPAHCGWQRRPQTDYGNRQKEAADIDRCTRDMLQEPGGWQ
jgi:hypothetical protein